MERSIGPNGTPGRIIPRFTPVKNKYRTITDNNVLKRATLQNWTTVSKVRICSAPKIIGPEHPRQVTCRTTHYRQRRDRYFSISRLRGITPRNILPGMKYRIEIANSPFVQDSSP
jgi:hypothetical protein